MQPLVLALPGNEASAAQLARSLPAELGQLTVRRFPDGESSVRIDSAMVGRQVLLVCTLDRPDEKLVPLLLTAATVRDLGAARVGLVAPYLAYLRQDQRFAPGEGITSRYVGRLLSSALDWLVTVDPHLHRYRSLAEVYTIPAQAIGSAPALAGWIQAHVPEPLLIGPDDESAQWVTAIAEPHRLPWVVATKARLSDRSVTVTLPPLQRWTGRTPVLVDDIVSTACTMVAALEQLGRAGLRNAVCVGVHAVFAAGAEAELRGAGAARIVTCNTIPHPTNAIDVLPFVAAGVHRMLQAACA